MNKWTRRFSSLLLAVLIAVSFTVPAFAQTTFDENPGNEVVSPIEDLISEPLPADGEEIAVPDEDITDEEPEEAIDGSSDVTEPNEEEPIEDIEDTLPGMPEDYKLTESQMQQKNNLTTYNVAGDLGDQKPGVDYVDNEFVFLCETEEEAAVIAAAYGAELISFNAGVGLAKISQESTFTLAEIISASASNENNLPPVAPNHIVHKHALPAEEYPVVIPKAPIYFPGTQPGILFSDPYTEDPNGTNYQWHHDNIGTFEAWQVTDGDPSVKVGVLDTGIDYNHPEFAHLFGSGRLTYEYTITTEAMDRDGHGTNVAGLIAANRDNNKGGSGVAPDITLHIVKVLNDTGGGTSASISEGMNKAVAAGCKVINMSLGGSFYNPLYETIIDNATKNGVIFVISAGNDGTSAKNYPGALKNAVTVAASTENNTRAEFSSFGNWVDVSAPGVRMLSTLSNAYDSNLDSLGAAGERYVFMSGTSQAAPTTTGVVALLVSKTLL